MAAGAGRAGPERLRTGDRRDERGRTQHRRLFQPEPVAGSAIYKVAKLAIYVFAAWFVWVSWRAVPHFADGFEAGLEFYRTEAVETLDEFAAAAQRIRDSVRVRLEAFRFSDQMSEAPSKRKFESLAGK